MNVRKKLNEDSKGFMYYHACRYEFLQMATDLHVFTPRSAAAGLSDWFCPASGVCKKKLKLRELEPITISKHEGDDQIHRILACVYLVEQYSGYILSIFSLSDYQCLPPFSIRSSVTPTAWIRSNPFKLHTYVYTWRGR